MFRRASHHRPHQTRPCSVQPHLEVLEDRLSPALIVVTNAGDSGAGTLRNAILASNATGGPNYIRFDIGPGVQTITPALNSPLPVILTPVTMNGSPLSFPSQVIELNGSALGTSGNNGLDVAAGNSTIANLVINRFSGKGIVLEGNGDDTVRSCLIGTDVTGTLARGNGTGVECQVSDSLILGNVVSGNTAGVSLNGASNDTVQNNLIGVNAQGTAAVTNNGGDGVSMFNLSNSALLDNVLSGNGVGLRFAAGSDNVIQGNKIGTNAAGTAAIPNTADGIIIESLSTGATSGTLLGGLTPGAGNLIANNGANGIDVTTLGTNTPITLTTIEDNVLANNKTDGVLLNGNVSGARIQGNTITGSGGRGIHLLNGANNNQLAPTLTSAVSLGGATTVSGMFSGGVSTTFRLEFFADSTANPNGGEGQTFLGARTATTNSSGSGQFTFTLPSAVPAGLVVSVTATNLKLANTSPFAADVTPTTTEELFVQQSADNQVHSVKFNNSGDPESASSLTQPGMVLGVVGAGNDGTGKQELFVLGLDNQLYALHLDASGNAAGGYFLAAPGQIQSGQVGYDASGRLEVFVQGMDNQIYALHFDAFGNPLGAYTLTAAGAVKSFTVGHDGNGHPELFVLGLDSQVYAQKFDATGNSASGYFLVAAGAVQSVSVAYEVSNNPELFVLQSKDSQVYALHFDASGNPVGGYFVAALGAVKSFSVAFGPFGTPELFALGQDNQVYFAKFDQGGNPSAGYKLLAAGAVKSVTVGHDGSGHPEAFVLGLDDQVYFAKLDANGNPTTGYFLATTGQVKSLRVSN